MQQALAFDLVLLDAVVAVHGADYHAEERPWISLHGGLSPQLQPERLILWHANTEDVRCAQLGRRADGAILGGFLEELNSPGDVFGDSGAGDVKDGEIALVGAIVSGRSSLIKRQSGFVIELAAQQPYTKLFQVLVTFIRVQRDCFLKELVGFGEVRLNTRFAARVQYAEIIGCRRPTLVHGGCMPFFASG